MNQDLEAKLWQLMDSVRGREKFDKLAVVEQISIFLYLKFLDAEADLEVQPPLFPDQAARYRWSRWPRSNDKILFDFVDSEVLPYMSSLVREAPQVAGFFRDARLEIREPLFIAQMVSVLDSIELNTTGGELRRNLLEDLLSASPQSTSDAEYRTPPRVRRLLVELVDPTPNDTVCDFACGTGGFLVDAVNHIERKAAVSGPGGDASASFLTYANASRQQKMEDAIFGVDVSHRMARIATVNLILHGVRHPHIEWTDSLKEAVTAGQEYSVLLSNPPMGVRVSPVMMRIDQGLKTTSGDVRFLELMLRSLAPGGRAAVIVRPGVLFRADVAHTRIRKRLIDEYRLLAVVQLAAGTFSQSIGISPCVLVFRPREPHDDRNAVVWFYEAPGAERERQGPLGRGSTLVDNALQPLLANWSSYRESGFTVAPGREAGTILGPDEREPVCWWATLGTIAAHEYSLSPAEYRPRLAMAGAGEDPVVLLRDLLRLEAEIDTGLRDLLSTLESSVPTNE